VKPIINILSSFPFNKKEKQIINNWNLSSDKILELLTSPHLIERLKGQSMQITLKNKEYNLCPKKIFIALGGLECIKESLIKQLSNHFLGTIVSRNTKSEVAKISNNYIKKIMELENDVIDLKVEVESDSLGLDILINIESIKLEIDFLKSEYPNLTILSIE